MLSEKASKVHLGLVKGEPTQYILSLESLDEGSCGDKARNQDRISVGV